MVIDLILLLAGGADAIRLFLLASAVRFVSQLVELMKEAMTRACLTIYKIHHSTLFVSSLLSYSHTLILYRSWHHFIPLFFLRFTLILCLSIWFSVSSTFGCVHSHSSFLLFCWYLLTMALILFPRYFHVHCSSCSNHNNNRHKQLYKEERKNHRLLSMEFSPFASISFHHTSPTEGSCWARVKYTAFNLRSHKTHTNFYHSVLLNRSARCRTVSILSLSTTSDINSIVLMINVIYVHLYYVRWQW